MKRWKKYIAAAVLVVILAGVGTAIVFQNEIQAVMYYLRYSSEEQEILAQENENRLDEALENANLSKEQITSEEKQEIKETVKTDQPIPKPVNKPSEKPVNKPVDSKVEQKPAQQVVTEKQEIPKEEAVDKEEQKYDAELASMVGEIYALRTSFVGQLDALLEKAKKEYIAIPEEERSKQKLSLASKYINIAGGLEKSCDNQMEEIIGRIELRLQETGGDISLVDEIRQVYKDEKALKKSYYMSLLD